MNACCKRRMAARDSSSPARRGAKAIPWIIPGGLLLLMPKCPVCFAAYIALFTGIGISIPAASWIRLSLIFLCVASLLLLAFRMVQKIHRRRIHKSLTPTAVSFRP